MFGIYSDGAIKRVNELLGKGHRAKPYDLADAGDLNQALLVAVAAYRDYWHYRDALILLEDDYDESIEYCDTAAWLTMSAMPDKVDSLTVDGYAALNAAVDVFDKLTERAMKSCAIVVKAALSAPPAVQMSVLGRVYKIRARDMDARINELLETLSEVEYHKAMPDNLAAFLKLMEGMWAAYV